MHVTFRDWLVAFRRLVQEATQECSGRRTSRFSQLSKTLFSSNLNRTNNLENAQPHQLLWTIANRRTDDDCVL